MSAPTTHSPTEQESLDVAEAARQKDWQQPSFLRERLQATGDLEDSGMGDLFDQELEAGVVRFQERHGLDTDGVVGPKTRAALNQGVEERIQRIVLNMERWRWMPRHDHRRYFLVNMAGFELRVIEGGSEVGGRGFPYKLRQDPGPHNALGRIKFMLPNRFNIYLHDTPHREHFDPSVRAFSSGCIRLGEPLNLASYVLGELNWTPERIQQTVDSGSRRVVTVPDPIPVFLVYWTAWVETDGTTHFRDDVYGRDKLLHTALTTGVPGGVRTEAP